MKMGQVMQARIWKKLRMRNAALKEYLDAAARSAGSESCVQSGPLNNLA